MNLLFRSLFVSLACLAAVSLPFSYSHASSHGLDNPAVVEAYIDGYVKQMMAEAKSPHGTVAIAQDGEFIFAKGYGYRDLEKRLPVDAEKTLFRPGSVSKLFTWVAVMQQVERGNLDLDTDVNEYLENFQIRDTWPGQPITLRHIMTHTPGFEDGGMGYLIIDDPNRIMPLAEAMKRYQPARINPPGAQTAYSNYGTALAGLIVANVSGVEFNQYIKANIFDVLGMQDSSFEEPLPEMLNNNMAGTYVVEGAEYTEKPYEIISNFGPAGALAATATDMLKFGLAALNGGEYQGRRILQQSSVDEMLSTQFTHDERVPGMGLGFYHTSASGFDLVGHGGDTAAFHSELVIDRSNNLVFFVSFGAGGGSKVRSQFKNAFYSRFFPVPEVVPTPPSDFASRAGKYAGQYGFWRSNFTLIERMLGLGGGLAVTPSEDNKLIFSMGPEATAYVEVGPNLFREAEPLKPGLTPLLAFQEDESGNITGFVAEGLPFMSTRKLAGYETAGFNLTMVAVSSLIFLFALLGYIYRRDAISQLSAEDKSARRASLFAAVANLAVLVIGAIVITAVGDQLMATIPFAVKAWLVLPIIAFIAGLYHAYTAVTVWRSGLLGGAFARVRFSFVTLAALFMCWFYWFWNMLGFQYMT